MERLYVEVGDYMMTLPAQNKVQYLWALESKVAKGDCLTAEREMEEWDRAMDDAIQIGWPDKPCVTSLSRREALRSRVKERRRDGMYCVYHNSIMTWINNTFWLATLLQWDGRRWRVTSWPRQKS